MESDGAAWRVDVIGGDVSGDPAALARALTVATEGPRRCLVVEAETGLRDALAELTAAAGVRGDQYRDLLDDMGRRQEALLRSLGAAAEPALIAQVREDVRDLADAFHTIHAGESGAEARALVSAYAPLWTARAVARALRERGVAAAVLDARDLLVASAYTDEGEARVDPEPSGHALRAALPARGVAVVAGGFATTPDQRTTALGADGTDHCGAAVAALLAATLTRWSTAGGLRAHPNGPALPTLSYATAGALGACGHPALRPRTWEPLRARGASMALANSDGVVETELTEGPAAAEVVALGVLAPVDVLRLGARDLGAAPAAWRGLIAALHDLGVAPLAVAYGSGAQTLCLTLREADGERARARVAHHFGWEGRGRVVQTVSVARGALIALAGGGARGLATALAALGDAALACAYGGDGGASVVVAEHALPAALAALREAYGLHTVNAGGP